MVLGDIRTRFPNTFASSSDQREENNQHNRLIDPYAANDAGSKKTPDHIMLPATREVLDQNPIFLSLMLT